MMNRNLYNDVLYLTFPELEKYDFFKHAFSTRIGGVSENEFYSMNLGFNNGDNKENVLENYRKFCKACGTDLSSLVASYQVHETNIKKVSKDDCGTGILKNKFSEGADVLITNEKGVTLVTYFADCVPLYFIDVSKKAIALVHAGWRGTVNSIAAKTVKVFQKEYNSNISDIICAIGPSIGKCCYKVDNTVKNEIDKLKLSDSLLSKTDNGKYMLDLQKTNEEILLKSGLLKENIFKANVCTSCNREWLFSHRATNGKRGTMAAFLWLV